MPATGQGTAPSAGATFSAATASYEGAQAKAQGKIIAEAQAGVVLPCRLLARMRFVRCICMFCPYIGQGPVGFCCTSADLVIHATASLQRNPVASEGSVGGGSSVEHEPTPDTPLISPGPMVQLGSPAAFEVSTRQQTPADHQAAAIGQAERDPATSQLDVPGVLRARGAIVCAHPASMLLATLAQNVNAAGCC